MKLNNALQSMTIKNQSSLPHIFISKRIWFHLCRWKHSSSVIFCKTKYCRWMHQSLQNLWELFISMYPKWCIYRPPNNEKVLEIHIILFFKRSCTRQLQRPVNMTAFCGFRGMSEAFPMSLIHIPPWLNVDCITGIIWSALSSVWGIFFAHNEVQTTQTGYSK